MLAILFDIDDTLYDQMIPFKSAYQECFGNQYQMCIEKLYPVYRRHSDEAYDASLRGEISMEAMYIYRLKKAMEDFGVIISDDVALEFQDIYVRNQKEIYISEQMKSILDYCKSNDVKMGIISNGPSSHQRRKIAWLGVGEWVSEEYIFISADLDVSKPDIQIFNIVLERMGLAAETTYYVGDSYRNDIIGAKNAGWNAIWLDRRGNTSDKEDYQPDYCVKDEMELEQVIRGIVESYPGK